MLFRKETNIKRSLFRKIVNGFIYFGVGVIIGLMMLFAISQTSTFREWVRKKILTTLNSSINGQLSIERIDGTIFTSIFLNNTLLLQGTDTLLFAKEIEVKASPLEILFKNIYLRKIALTDAKLSLLKDEKGRLNISDLFKSSEKEIPDTTASEFTFKLRVADLTLKNVDFKLQSYNNKYSAAVYDTLNPDDFRLNGINLSMDAFANIVEKEIRFSINNFSVNSNLSGFNLRKISGDFLIGKDEIGVHGLFIKTSRSIISLNAEVRNFPVWDDSEIRIEKVPMRIDLDADKFNFDDLTNFIPDTELLQGLVKTKLSVIGTLNDLYVRNMDIGFNNTRIKGKGNVKNIPGGDRMIIDMNLSGTYIHTEDPNILLETLNIPEFVGYGTLVFDTLYFKGEPLKFTSSLMVKTDRGEFDGVVVMDLTASDMAYDITLFTQNLDLGPIINLPSNLNSHIVINGKGTSPDRMQTNLIITANWSEIKNKKYRSLKLKSSALNRVINYDLSFRTDTASGKISGDIDFKNPVDPTYNINAVLNNFNFADIIPGSELESDVNLNIAATGNNFNPDSLELFAVIGVDSSVIGGIELDKRKVIIDLRNDDESGRIINVVSNLADITLSGQFSILDIATLIRTEVILITDFIDHNLKKINPLVVNTNNDEPKELLLPEHLIDINYSVEFKDFELLSLLLGNIDMEIDGDISGLMQRNGNIMTLSALLDVNYFKFIDNDDLYFLSGMTLIIESTNDYSTEFPESFNLNIDVSIHELFLNEKIHDINFSTNIYHNNVELTFSGQLDDYLGTQLKGNVKMEDSTAKIIFDSLYVVYNDFEIWNTGEIDIDFSNKKFIVNSFKMTHQPGEIELSGFFSLTEDQNLILHVNNLRGKELSNKILFLPPGTSFGSKIDLSAYLQGTIQYPLLNLNLTADSISIRNKKLGTLITSASYNDGELNFKLDILDTLYNIDAPILKIDGIIPVRLSSQPEEEYDNEGRVQLSLQANKFDLIMITGIIPPLKNLQGKLDGIVTATGAMDNLELSGYAKINNISFVASANNIEYEAYASILFDHSDIIFDSLYVKNLDGIKGGGTILAKGKIVQDNLELTEIAFYAAGQLKVLGKETRAVNPTIYGDLSVKSNGDIFYIYNDKENSFKADFMIQEGADVTISGTRSAFSNSSEKFIYTFKEYDAALTDVAIIDSLIILADVKSRREGTVPSKPNTLNLQVKVTVEDEAKVVFELAPEFKQNLTTYLDGSFEYNIINETPVAQGELKLLEGSKLEFIKPFDATGAVKFFDKLDDPYLDIIGTYSDYYLLSDSAGTGGGEKEVQIRIKLQGPFSELYKNFAQQEGNLSVYMRENNLTDFQLDATKTSSDAIMFIILNKFTDDATSQDRNFAASTATSFAGSLVGALLNQTFGDFVRSVRFQQVGADTKVSLLGKAGPVRYEIGGTSLVFQDISRANIKIELPVTSLGNLILRLQRREPLQGTTTYGEMINEFGIKYRFDF